MTVEKVEKVENYYKIKLDTLFGVIATQFKNLYFIPDKSGNLGDLCLATFDEYIFIWNLRNRKITNKQRTRENDKICSCRTFYDGNLTISLGFESGYVAIYDYTDEDTIEERFSLKSHKNHVNFIKYCEPEGTTIISGGKDSSISVIDIVKQRGFKLEGHKSKVTDACYIPIRDILISMCQNGVLKFWQLSLRHCFKTVDTKTDNLYRFVYIPSTRLLVASGNQNLKAWQIDWAKYDSFEANRLPGCEIDKSLSVFNSDLITLNFLNEIEIDGKKTVTSMVIENNNQYMACIIGKTIEIFQVMSEEAVQKHFNKQIKKAKRTNTPEDDIKLSITDYLKPYQKIKDGILCRTIDFISTSNNGKTQLNLVKSMSDNVIELMKIDTQDSSVSENKIQTRGHRHGIIYTQFMDKGSLMLSVSNSDLKIWDKEDLEVKRSAQWRWNRSDGVLDRTDCETELAAVMESGNGMGVTATAAVILPFERYVAVGTACGRVLIYSVRETSSPAPIQSLLVAPGARITVVATVSRTHLLVAATDGSVSKLEFGFDSTSSTVIKPATPENCVKHEKGVMSGAVSDSIVFLGFEDCKGRVYKNGNLRDKFADLYGHSEPVSCAAIRTDNGQIATGSGDKSLRLWEMPFGSMRIFRGHNDTVTAVTYLRDSLIISADRTGRMVLVDGINMSQISVVESGRGKPVTALSVCLTDVLAGMGDSSLRLMYEDENEIITRETEEEAEQEKQLEQELSLEPSSAMMVGGGALSLLECRSIRSNDGADLLEEAVSALMAEPGSEQQLETKKRIDALRLDCPLQLLAMALDKTCGPGLETSLSLMPHGMVLPMLTGLTDLLQTGWNAPLVLRAAAFLCQLHVSAASNDARFWPVVDRFCKLKEDPLLRKKKTTGIFYETMKHLEDKNKPELLDFRGDKKIAVPRRQKKK